MKQLQLMSLLPNAAASTATNKHLTAGMNSNSLQKMMQQQLAIHGMAVQERQHSTPVSLLQHPQKLQTTRTPRLLQQLPQVQQMKQQIQLQGQGRRSRTALQLAARAGEPPGSYRSGIRLVFQSSLTGLSQQARPGGPRGPRSWSQQTPPGRQATSQQRARGCALCGTSGRAMTLQTGETAEQVSAGRASLAASKQMAGLTQDLAQDAWCDVGAYVQASGVAGQPGARQRPG